MINAQWIAVRFVGGIHVPQRITYDVLGDP